MDELSLTPTPAADEGVSLTPSGTASVTPSDKVTDYRSAMANYGLGENSPGYDTIRNQIATGQEPILRSNMAMSATDVLQMAKVKAIAKTITSGPLTPEVMAKAQSILNTDPKVEADTVFEKFFAHRYAQDNLNKNPDLVNEAGTEATGQAQNVSSDFVTKLEYFRTKLQDAETAANQQSWAGWGLDKATEFIPLKRFFSQGDVAAKVEELWRLPFSAAKAKFDEEYNHLLKVNPSEAREFAQNVFGYSRQQSFADGLHDILDLTVLPAPKVLKGLTPRSSDGIKNMARSVIESSGTDTPAQRLAKLGNTEDAAAVMSQRLRNLEQTGELEVNGTKLPVMSAADPIGGNQVLESTMPSAFRPDAIVKQPGTLPVENVRRMAEALAVAQRRIDNQILRAGDVERMTEPQMSVSASEAFKLTQERYPSITDNITNQYLVRDLKSQMYYAVTRVGQKAPVFEYTPPNFGTVKGRLTADGVVRVTHVENPKSIDALWYHLNTTETVPPSMWQHEITSEIEGKGPAKSPLWQHAVEEQARARNEKVRYFGKNDSALWQWGVTQAGTQDALPLKTAAQADMHAQLNLGLEHTQYFIRQEGDKFWIDIPTVMVEKSHAVRSVPVPTNHADTPGWWFTGRLRGSAGQLAPEHIKQRLTAQEGPMAVLSEMKNVLADGPQLARSERKDMERVLSFENKFINEKTNERGKFSSTPADLQNTYSQVLGRLPTERETHVYFLRKMLNDFDYVYQNHAAFREMAIRGFEQHSLPDAEGMFSRPFLAAEQKEMPWTTNGGGVSVVYRDGKFEAPFWHDRINPGQKATLTKQLEGYKVLKIANPLDRPFSTQAGSNLPIQYIITRGHKTEPLPKNMMPYQAGGHVINEPAFKTVMPEFVLDPGTGKNIYVGDRTILAHNTLTEAKHWAEEFNTVSKMMRDGVDAAVVSKYITNHLPAGKNWEEAYAGYLNKDHPILVADWGPSGNSMRNNPEVRAKYSNSNLVDMTTSDHNPLVGVDTQYMRDRNGPLMQIKNEGTMADPMYKLEAAPQLDPLPAMQKGLATVFARNRYMNDYRNYAVESWINQHLGVLKTTLSPEEIRANPYYHFYNGELQKATANNQRAVSNAAHSRELIRNFLGEQSIVERNTEVALQALASRLPGGAPERIANWLLPKLASGPQFIRMANSLAQFAGDIAQFGIQAVTSIHAVAVSPLHGLQGLAATTMHAMLAMTENPNVQKHIDGIFARASGWKKGWLMESVQSARDSGFLRIGNEMSFRDLMPDVNVIPDLKDKVLNSAYKFMWTGDRATRMTGWHTAYHEWRSANPEAQLTKKVQQDLLFRANTLSVNMTRESLSPIQKGWASVPLQWGTFVMRLGEQMSPGGKVLTGREKATALLTYSTMFGVPAGITAGSYGMIPVYDLMRQYLLKDGQEKALNEDWRLRFAMDGVASVLSDHITGQKYNVGSRLGPNTMPLAQSITHSFWNIGQEKSFIETVSGPSGSFVEKIWKVNHPFFMGMVAGMKNPDFPLEGSDYMDALRVVKAFDQGYKAYIAFSASKLMSKNDGTIKSGTNGIDAAMLLLGFNRMDVLDNWAKMDIKKQAKDAQEDGQKLLLRELRAHLDASNKQDWKEANVRMTRAIAIKQLYTVNEQQWSQVMKQAVEQGGVDNVTATNKAFYDNPQTINDNKAMKRWLQKFNPEFLESQGIK